MIRSPADYMAGWENVPLDPKTTKKKKQLVNLEPPRPMAARLINSFLSEEFEFNLLVLYEYRKSKVVTRVTQSEVYAIYS